MMSLNRINLLLVILFLVSCSTTQTKKIHQHSKEQTIDMGGYTVNIPPGENWDITVYKEASGKEYVEFLKQSKPKALPRTVILVLYNWVAQKDMLQWSEERIADDYRDGEVGDMTLNGVLTGSFELHNVTKDSVILNGKKLYTLSYTTSGGKFGTDKINECILYMYFHPNFKETHKFYLFIFNEVNKKDRPHPPDLTPVHSLIESLHIKN